MKKKFLFNQERLSLPYYTMTHGDFWPNNMMFHMDSSDANASKVKFFDFQLSKAGTGLYDLVYFLYVCTDRQFRSEHLDEVLQAYYDVVIQYVPPEDRYTFQDFKGHFEEHRILSVLALSVSYFISTVKSICSSDVQSSKK